MPRPGSEPDWPALLELWQDPEAQALLSQPASQDPSINPHIQQLLSRTQKILAPSVKAEVITYKHAAAAVQCAAIALLAKLLHLLQQQPILSTEFILATSNDPYESVWFCVLETFCCILDAMRAEMATFPPEISEDPGLLSTLGWRLPAGNNLRQQQVKKATFLVVALVCPSSVLVVR